MPEKRGNGKRPVVYHPQATSTHHSGYKYWPSLGIDRTSSALWWVQRHPQVKSFLDQIHMSNAHPLLEISTVCEDILGHEITVIKMCFPVFHPACLKCIWWQNPVSKEHILENTEPSFFLTPTFWGFKHTIQILLSNVTATWFSH